jgi:hypothetical protein
VRRVWPTLVGIAIGLALIALVAWTVTDFRYQ